MYNRYIPQETSYTWVGTDQRHREEKKEPVTGAGPKRTEGWLSFLTGHTDRTGAGRSYGNAIFSSIRSLWNTNAFDSGDLLLVLILLLLLKEGEDPELIIALGLVLLLGAGEERDEKSGKRTGDG